jgi:hypothetical protein
VNSIPEKRWTGEKTVSTGIGPLLLMRHDCSRRMAFSLWNLDAIRGRPLRHFCSRRVLQRMNRNTIFQALRGLCPLGVVCGHERGTLRRGKKALGLWCETD